MRGLLRPIDIGGLSPACCSCAGCCGAAVTDACLACATSTWADVGLGQPISTDSITDVLLVQGASCVWAHDDGVDSHVGAAAGRVKAPAGVARDAILVTTGQACIGATAVMWPQAAADVAGLMFSLGAAVFVTDNGDGTSTASWASPSGAVTGGIYTNAGGISLHVHACDGQLGYGINGLIVAQYALSDFPNVVTILSLLGGFVVAIEAHDSAQIGTVTFDCLDSDFLAGAPLLDENSYPILDENGNQLLEG